MSGNRCPTCGRWPRHQTAAFREIHRRWHQGQTPGEIAQGLHFTVQTVRNYITQMRAEGWDMPYRLRPPARKRVAT